MTCDLEYIGQLGSDPHFHIWRCHTHPHNFFHNRKELTECEKAHQMLPNDALVTNRSLPQEIRGKYRYVKTSADEFAKSKLQSD